jgi:hypothetical protein
MLPDNMTFDLVNNAVNLPVFKFAPSSPDSGLAANVRIYQAPGDVLIASGVSPQPGATFQFPSSPARLRWMRSRARHR